MDNYEDDEMRQAVPHDETRDNPFSTRRPSGMASGIAFLVGAILVIFAIVAYGAWTGGNNPQGPTTTTIEQPRNQPAQPPATKPPPAPG